MKFLFLVAALFFFSPTHASCLKVMLGQTAAVQQNPQGPHLDIKAPATGLRSFESIRDLKLGQFNVENMYNYQGKWEYNAKGEYVKILPAEPKPEKRWRQIQEVLERADNDIMVWEEVEDAAAAEDFIESHLGDRYNVILIEGNDSRGIDIAFVYKKDLPFDIEVQSHKNLKRKDKKTPLFSRDFPVIKIRKAGAAADSKPLLIIAEVHGKSKRDSPGDPLSSQAATEQFEASAEILAQYEKENPNTAIFVVGDMNRDLNKDPEIKPLWDLGFKETFDLTVPPLPIGQRISHCYFPKDLPPVYSLLDGILLNQAGQKLGILKSSVMIPYLQADGSVMPLPNTFEERRLQGSDHLARQAIIDFQKVSR